jgi:glycosyltransferase involved in cell wall biosynthesis
LRNLVRSLGLEERVEIGVIAATERQQLTELLARAGLVVLLSEYEAHPVSVMEALSLGCRVLVSDTSGLRELAQKGLCRAVPLNATPRTIALAMAQELAAAPRDVNLNLPDWDACARSLLKIYQSALHEAGGSASAANRADSESARQGGGSGCARLA